MSESTGPASGQLRLEITGDAFIDSSTACEIVSLTLFDLEAQAVGHEESDGNDVLVAGFSNADLALDALETIQRRHATLVLRGDVERVDSADWVTAQRAGLEPTEIGRWHIRAPWDPAPPNIDPLLDIVIDPGVAFGHGAHPTTRLIIELMLRCMSDTRLPDRVVDLGTGTGVAALIAARLGVEVLAVENDPDACEVARRNIERNSTRPNDDTANRIQLVRGDAAETDISNHDLVVANVTLDVQRLIAPTCTPADRVIVSGILCSQVRAMQDLYPTHVASTIRTAGQWAGIEFSSLAPRCRKKRNE